MSAVPSSVLPLRKLPSWEEAWDRLFLRLLPDSAPEHLSRPFADLSLTIRLAPSSPGGSSIPLPRNADRIWQISREELWDRAAFSSLRLYPPRLLPVKTVLSTLEERLGDSLAEKTAPGTPYLYVLTNRFCRYGAACIAYPGLSGVLTGLFGAFYLLPSSLHEWLLLPRSPLTDAFSLGPMIRSVNREVLLPQDVLADHAYAFSTLENPFPRIWAQPAADYSELKNEDLILDESVSDE